MDFFSCFDTRPLDDDLLIGTRVVSGDDFIESDFLIEIDLLTRHIPIRPVE